MVEEDDIQPPVEVIPNPVVAPPRPVTVPSHSEPYVPPLTPYYPTPIDRPKPADPDPLLGAPQVPMPHAAPQAPVAASAPPLVPIGPNLTPVPVLAAQVVPDALRPYLVRMSAKDIERSLPRLEENPTQAKALEFLTSYTYFVRSPDYESLEHQLQQAVVNRLQGSAKTWFIQWCATNNMKEFPQAFQDRFLNTTRLMGVTEKCMQLTKKQGESTMEYGRRLQTETEPMLALLKDPEDKAQSAKMVVEHFIRQLPGWFQKIVRPSPSEKLSLEVLLARTKAEIELSGDPSPAVKSVTFGAVQVEDDAEVPIASVTTDMSRPAVGHTKNYNGKNGRNKKGNQKARSPAPAYETAPVEQQVAAYQPAPQAPRQQQQKCAASPPQPQAPQYQVPQQQQYHVPAPPYQSQASPRPQANVGYRQNASPKRGPQPDQLRRSPRNHPGSQPQVGASPQFSSQQVVPLTQVNPGMGVANPMSSQPGLFHFGAPATGNAPGQVSNSVAVMQRHAPCFRCTQLGHWRTECPRQYQTCASCRIFGHIAEECGKKIPEPKPLRNAQYAFPPGAQVVSYPVQQYYGPPQSNVSQGNGIGPSQNMTQRR